MTKNTKSVKEQRRMLPHQARFVEDFFADPVQRGIVLRADVGLGSSFAIANLTKEVHERTPTARILILSPKALSMQMRYELLDLGVDSDLVDRFRYRELQDAADSEGSVWSQGTVTIVSMDFAKQKDVAASLASVPWTLLIVKEAHLLRSELRRELVSHLVAGSPDLRVVLVTVTGAENIPTFGLPTFRTIEWTKAEVVDHEGKPLFVQMPTHLEIVEIQENGAEQQIRMKVDEIGTVLGDSERAASLYRSILVRSLASSPAAIEERLRTLRSQLAHGYIDDVPVDEDEVGDLDSAESPLRSLYVNGQQLIISLDDCLGLLESNSVDSKLNAFVETLVRLRDNKQVSSMCILTEFRATLFYLESQLQEMGFNPLVFHGTMSYDEREHTVNTFKQSGGVLLATNAGMEGLALAEVESLFLYDIPWNPQQLQQVYGRFQRFGRKAPLHVYLLSDPKAGRLFQGLMSRLKELCS